MNNAFAFMLILVFQAEGAPFNQEAKSNTHHSVQFLVLADWGGMPHHPYSTMVQVNVAQQMAITAERENASFVVSLGDNIYLEGVHDEYDSRFKTTFEEVYYQDSLHIPWYLIAGNHDYYGNVRAQMIYSAFSSRWNFPYFYYKETRTLPGGKVLDILMLDTIVLCGNTYGRPDGGQGVKGPKSVYRAEKEWTWIEQNLKDSTADYLLVCGHYPVFSVGANGPTDILLTRLEPLLYEHRVTAYLSGHDHNIQHIQTNRGEERMNYFIIGSGSYTITKQLNLGRVPGNSLKFFFAEHGGFALFDVSDTRMKINFIDSKGIVRYEYSLRPRN
ncbi:tartrate-resistant acid phosphatase type 5-like [Mercenaria mercenaria]|uniref:tartrate-resistant acid phosphatase type 5-like n=1 Tax=Mercenaria mercenaria TaxID=6596 RepID=UPI00234F86AA|nr:tartrate-resistant acid phosphatase type 5-like [Mercenaria mercenaria]